MCLLQKWCVEKVAPLPSTVCLDGCYLARQKRVHHDGVRETLNSVHVKYWMLRGREAVKKIVRKCVTCRKFEGKYFTTPQEPPLPPSRVSDDPPFTNTSLARFTRQPMLERERYTYVCSRARLRERSTLNSQTIISVTSFLKRFDVLLPDEAYLREVKNIVRSAEVHRNLATKGAKNGISLLRGLPGKGDSGNAWCRAQRDV